MRRFAHTAFLLLSSFAGPATARLRSKKELSLYRNSHAQGTQTSYAKSEMADESEKPVRRVQSAGGIPSFEGDWEEVKAPPLNVAEAQGAVVGRDFLLVSGFYQSWEQTTKQVYKLDTTNGKANWVRQDNIPYRQGVTHTGFVVVEDKFYVCGAFVGGHPGNESRGCYVFDNSIAPGNGQWSRLPKLPDGGRGGGGLAYIHEANSLLFAGGGTRRRGMVDHKDAWILNLDNLGAGWKKTADKPFAANHLSAVTAQDCAGNWRIFFMGGQLKEDEGFSENPYVYEFVYNPTGKDKWIRRQDMPIARGHASSSTHRYGCGLVIIGGRKNTGEKKGPNSKLSDISYYDIDKDSWTKIGDLPKKMNTPVCDFSMDVGGQDWLYCESGHIRKQFSFRRKIRGRASVVS